jgi:hypothetical protein
MNTITQLKLESTTELDIQVKSDTTVGLTYRVTKTDEGKWACTCASFRFNKQRDVKFCKHIRAVHREIMEKFGAI